MKILNLYIAKDLLLTTIIAVAILTFVLLSGSLFKAFDLLAQGFSPALLVKFLLLMMPEILRFTIPTSLLCATVLVFSRLSADNEITAMKASGVSLWQIISPTLFLSLVLSAFCFWLGAYFAPVCRYKADLLARMEAVKNPLALLEPGRFVDELPGYAIRIGRREGNELYDVHILVMNPEDGTLQQDITARSGKISLHEEERILELMLRDTTFANLNLAGKEPTDKGVDRVATDELVFSISYGEKFDEKPLLRKLKYMDITMIFARIYLDTERGRNTTPHYVEIHQRMSLALSPIAFLLIGIPFAVRQRRAETSVGLLAALVLGLGFYAFLLLTDSLQLQTHLHPELLVWIPNIIYQSGGLWALVMIGKR